MGCERCDVLTYMASFDHRIVLSFLNRRGEYGGLVMHDLGGRFVGYIIMAYRLKNLVNIEWYVGKVMCGRL